MREDRQSARVSIDGTCLSFFSDARFEQNISTDGVAYSEVARYQRVHDADRTRCFKVAWVFFASCVRVRHGSGCAERVQVEEVAAGRNTSADRDREEAVEKARVRVPNWAEREGATIPPRRMQSTGSTFSLLTYQKTLQH